MFKRKELFRTARALLCAAGCFSLIFNFTGVNAQTKRARPAGGGLGGGPIISTSLADSFDDSDGDGRAALGSEVTYTATVTNTGNTTATGVGFSVPVDANSTLVTGSVQVQPDLTSYVLRCDFSTANGGSGGCSLPSSGYSQTSADNTTILGGQGSRLNLISSNVAYDAGTGVFAFDANVQNLLAQTLGTIDNVTLEAAGVRLFQQSAVVSAGNGTIGAANADGTGTFTGPNQSFFQYNEMIAQDATSIAKTLQYNVPSTVENFTIDFLVSTKAAVKLVINEAGVNPGGTILDANGEWFELYNAGQFPVYMQNFYIGDSAASGDRPLHLISQPLTIQPGGYKVLGNTTNTTNNGGVPVDYAYGSALQLANSLDSIRVLSPYSIPTNPVPTPPIPGYFIELDRVNYLSALTSAQNGISRELKNPALDNTNMDGSNWGDPLVTSVYGPGGRGTPGYQNDSYTPFAPDFNESKVEKSGAFDNNPVRLSDPAETVSVNLGAISPGGTAVVTYRVTVADPMPTGTHNISNQSAVAGDNFVTDISDDPATPAADDATVTPVGVAPTAANVTIGGRVTDSFGRTVRGAQVVLFDSNATRTVTTNSFGYYRFAGIPAGSTALVSVNHKRLTFAPQVVSVTDNVVDLNFTATGVYFAQPVKRK